MDERPLTASDEVEAKPKSSAGGLLGLAYASSDDDDDEWLIKRMMQDHFLEVIVFVVLV